MLIGVLIDGVISIFPSCFGSKNEVRHVSKLSLLGQTQVAVLKSKVITKYTP